MSHESQLQRLKQRGLLSEAQAERLQAALQNHSAVTPPLRRSRPWLLFLGLAAVLLSVLSVFWFGGGEPPPNIQSVDTVLNQPGATGAMHKGLNHFLAIALLLVLPFLWFVWSYNGLIDKEEAVFGAWGQVESNYQRRADLIPGLVETVSTYLRHERETLQNVTAERSLQHQQATGAVDELISTQEKMQAVLKQIGGQPPGDDRQLQALQAAEQQLSLGMRRLFAVAESYPQLRASDQMLELQAQLEGSENRINVARMRFNEAAESFNAAIRRLPGSLLAALGNFQRKAYFEADEGAAKRVEVQFSD